MRNIVQINRERIQAQLEAAQNEVSDFSATLDPDNIKSKNMTKEVDEIDPQVLANYKSDLRKSYEHIIDPNAANPFKKFEELAKKPEIFENRKKKKKKKVVEDD